MAKHTSGSSCRLDLLNQLFFFFFGGGGVWLGVGRGF